MADRFSYCIVVPVFGRRREVEEVLRGLDAAAARLPAGARVEVRLVFDGDREGFEYFSGRPVELRLPLHCHLVTNAGPCPTRNYGALVTDADVVAFLDSDILVQPTYLEGLVGYFESHPEAAVVRGAVHAVPPRPSRWHRALVRGVFVANDGREWYFSSANFAWKRDAFLRAGGFDPVMRLPSCEDLDLCWRWILRERGAVGFCAEMAIVHPTTKMSAWDAIREFRRKRYDAILFARFPGRYARVYGYQWFQLAALAVLALGVGWMALSHPLYGVLAVLAGLAYATYRTHDGDEELRYTLGERVAGVLALPILPVAYAVNFLEGLVTLVLLRPATLRGRRGRWARERPAELLPPGHAELDSRTAG